MYDRGDNAPLSSPCINSRFDADKWANCMACHTDLYGMSHRK